MEILEQLELVDVTYDDKRVSLVFLDAERGEIREIKWSKQAYDKATGKFIDSDEQAERVEQQAQEHFGLSFDRLSEAIGERRDVYAYDTYNRLSPSNMRNKFDSEMVGQIMEVRVDAVVDDGNAIFIEFEYDGEKYYSKMGYSDFLDAKQQYFVNPIKQKKQYAKFEEKFGISIDNKEELVGQKVMIEIKIAFNTHVYAEIKPFPKKKKK